MLSFLLLGVLDEIWDVIESVSEGFLTYSYCVSHVSRFTVSDISNISLTAANLYIVNPYSGARPDTTSCTTFVEAYCIR